MNSMATDASAVRPWAQGSPGTRAAMRQGRFRVDRRRQLGADIVELAFLAPAVARRARPGQFLGLRVEGEGFPLLRRPMGLSGIHGGRVEVSFRVAGAGTRWLADRCPGDLVDLLGPLGHGFAAQEGGPTLLVGGGLGVARLLPVAERGTGGPVTALLGFGRSEEVYGRERIERTGGTVRIATEDGSVGWRGLVTELLEAAIDQGVPGQVLACGPRGLLRAVKQICARHGRHALLALEERMACGFGACLGCSMGGLLVCRDGPVFAAERVQP